MTNLSIEIVITISIEYEYYDPVNVLAIYYQWSNPKLRQYQTLVILS